MRSCPDQAWCAESASEHKHCRGEPAVKRHHGGPPYAASLGHSGEELIPSPTGVLLQILRTGRIVWRSAAHSVGAKARFAVQNSGGVRDLRPSRRAQCRRAFRFLCPMQIGQGSPVVSGMLSMTCAVCSHSTEIAKNRPCGIEIATGYTSPPSGAAAALYEGAKPSRYAHSAVAMCAL